MTIPKKKGEPVTAGVVKITADGKHMIVGYGYFDLEPQIFTYRKGRDGSWIEDKPLPQLPTDMDILSMEFGAGSALCRNRRSGLPPENPRTAMDANRWSGSDSAIQGISTVGGPHLAACWGVYNPVSADAVERVIHASFLLHRDEDEAGPNIRAFGFGSTRQDRIIKWSRRLPAYTPAAIVGKPGEGSMRFPTENSVPRISIRQMEQ